MSPSRARVEVETAGSEPVEAALYSVDGGAWEPMAGGPHRWHASIRAELVTESVHTIDVMVLARDGRQAHRSVGFVVRL